MFFALSASDKAEIRKQRGDHNRLGYSIQLCALRYLGFAPDDLKSIPWEALSYIALQIDVDPEALHSYGNRIHTRTDHFNQVQKYLGFRKASSNYLRNFHKWLVERALEHDKPTFLLQLSCEKLAREKIVRIGITRLERMIATARQDAQDETYRLLLPILTREHRELLDNLLIPDADKRITKLFWLRNEAKSNNAAEILSGIKKITFLRQLGVENWDLSEVNPNRLKLLARIGRKVTNQYLQKAGEGRRYTVLISFLHQTMIDVTDEIIDMYNQCLWDLYIDAKKDLEEFQKSIFKAMTEKLSLFKELARIVVNLEVEGQDLRSMIYGKVASLDAIRSAIKEADKMVLPEDGGHLNFYGNRYSYIGPMKT